MKYYPDIRLVLITCMISLLLSGCGTPEDSWELAERENTQTAYLGFLAKYPEGELADRARGNLLALKELRAWERAKFRDRTDNYDRFLQEYPKSAHADAARKRVIELERDEAWEATVDEDNILALEAFLQNYPDAPQRPEAEQLIASLQPEEKPPLPAEPPGQYRLQLAAFRSAGSAEREATRLASLFPDILPESIGVEQSDTGTFYLLKSVPMNREEAQSVCTALKKSGQDCLIINR